jgi:2-phosphosulfolactate phosphatase
MALSGEREDDMTPDGNDRRRDTRARRPLAIDVALTPAFVHSAPGSRRHTVYIVVDVVRATTTLCVLFERGCRAVWVAPGIVAAREAATRAPGRSGRNLLAGESGGVAPPGFDLGNSPSELARADLAGHEVVFATTNGTRAVRACAGGFAIFAGAYRNAGAVARTSVAAALRMRTTALEGQPKPVAEPAPEASEASAPAPESASDIVVVCAGRQDRPAYDDTLCAGYLVERIGAEAAAMGYTTVYTEGARIARAVNAVAGQHPGARRALLAASDAGRAVCSVGLGADLDWCVALDATRIVPAVAMTAETAGHVSMDAVRDLLEVRPVAAEAGEEWAGVHA